MQVIERQMELENGQKVTFTAGPRHPFWKISFEQGPVPKELSGTYTDYERAVQKVKQYVENRRARNRTSVKEGVTEKVK